MGMLGKKVRICPAGVAREARYHVRVVQKNAREAFDLRAVA
jgi:hypothetical protein